MLAKSSASCTDNLGISIHWIALGEVEMYDRRQQQQTQSFPMLADWRAPLQQGPILAVRNIVAPNAA